MASCRGKSNHIAASDGGALGIIASRETAFCLPRPASVFFADIAATDKKKEMHAVLRGDTRCIGRTKYEKI